MQVHGMKKKGNPDKEMRRVMVFSKGKKVYNSYSIEAVSSLQRPNPSGSLRNLCKSERTTFSRSLQCLSGLRRALALFLLLVGAELYIITGRLII